MTAHLNYGVVSNGRVGALVGPHAEIDWLCMPSLDAPSVFAALLDPVRGGRMSIEVNAGASWSQRYREASNVLVTACEVSGGAFEVVDVASSAADGTPAPTLLRLLRPLRGSPTVRVCYEPRPGYAKDPAVPSQRNGTTITTGNLQLAVVSERAEDGELVASSVVAAKGWVLTRPVAFVLSWGSVDAGASFTDVRDAIARATKLDRAFVSSLNTSDPRAIRSALVLRALTAPSGAIAAALTTSIPEAIGAPRTWDYRYAWIRDGCFAAHALLRLGHAGAADRLLDFFAAQCPEGRPQPLYGLDGRKALPEQELSHLAGFAATKPVRIGNAAATQTQHDAMGQLIWLATTLRDATGVAMSSARRDWIETLAQHALEIADVPDAGIWEFRARPRMYTYSQAWLWVALDRAATTATGARAETFAREATRIRARILEAADRVGFFAQDLEGDDPDASSLQLASLGLVAPDDPRFVASVDRVEAQLGRGRLLARYAVTDDFGETDNAFLLCQLWRIVALFQIGRRREASALLGHFEALANPVGLYAEDAVPDSERLLGNFPQAYSHAGLIEAVLAAATS